ncbi:MAG: tRNA dihydrouridine synthase DusB [Propionibacteriaceae bacterium]|nr:tRNA dihydrouridine synthase DusB [Propionibacteriaceae bacterium]
MTLEAGRAGLGPVRWGGLELPLPVLLAPMAQVTTSAYRRLCREQAEAGTGLRPAGLFTCEMITARGVAERMAKTLAMMRPDPGDPIRSVQLYGLDPAVLGRAVQIGCGELGLGHIDLNFGCPAPKVTRKGGGGVLPWKLDRFAALLQAAVAAARPYGVPVTVKTRLGLDDDHLTYLEAGRIAQDSGCAAITLHARTVVQAYGGRADWDKVAELVQALDIPVFGNGDIWEAGDALALVARTGCAGVVVGRGCLGRPWLFFDLARAWSQGVAPAPSQPDLGQVVALARRHAELQVAHFDGDEPHALADLRKHMAWYFKGFALGGELRHRLGLVASLAEFERLTADLDPATPYPVEELGRPRGRQGSPRASLAMPQGWLDSRRLDQAELAEDESDPSGG